MSLVLGAAFAAPQRPTTHAACGAVVGSENHQGILIQLEILEGLQDTPDAIIHFLHMGTVHVAFGTLEILGPGIARFVDMSVRDVTKEGLLLVFLDEGNRFVGEDFGQ